MDQHNNQGFGQFYVEDYGATAGANEILQGNAPGDENFSNFAPANLWESANPSFQPQYTTSGVNHGFTNDYATAGYEQHGAFQNQASSHSPPQFQNSQYGGMFNDMGQPSQFHDYGNNFSTQSPQAQHPNPGHQTTIGQVNPAGLGFAGQQQASQQYQQSHPQQAGQPDQFLQHQFVAYEHNDHHMAHSIPQSQHGKMNGQPQIAPALQQAQGVSYDTYQTSQPAQYSHQPDQGHFGAPFHSFGIQETRVQSGASPSNAQPLAPASNRTPQHASSLPPQHMAQVQGHPQQPLVSAPQVVGAASNGVPLQPSAKPSARPPQVIDGPPRVVEDLVKSRSGVREEELFPGVPYLVVGSSRMAEPVKVPDMPMVQLDMSRNLGRAHLGQKHPLACELIKSYTDEESEHPENRDALKAQLMQQFKQQGKTVPWKAYNLKGWGQAGKDASPEADGSDYESEVEEVRSATRPDDPVEAAAWDSIGIVYLDAEAAKDKKNVGAAVKAFGDFIKKIREDIKAEPEAKDPNVLSPNQQRLLRAVEAAEDKGDDQVLVNLGGNNPLISNLVFSLHNLPKTADLSGRLPKAVLRLLSRCSLQQDILDKVKFPRLEKRLMEKGDDEVKRLVKSVHKAVKKDDKTDMARSSSQQGATHPPSKSSATSSETSTENGASSKAAKPASRVPSDTASSKRPREDEPDARASKKFAADPANGAAQAPSKASPTKNASTVTQHTVAPAKPWSGSALLPGKTRPAVKPAAKTDGLKTEKAELSKTAASKSGVLSKTEVSKLVATKRDPLKAEASKVKKPAVSRAEPSSSSKLGALLQEISMPKKQPAASTTPEAVPEKPETPEEKEKRLRKEKRRHLRVSWKEGDELTQVRVFQKDIEEDEGREDNMIRDARDDRSEGMVLKQSLKKGGMDVDDDEDDDIPYRPWVAPTPLDLSSLPAEKREKNYVTRGGTLPIQTQQQKEMQDRENNVLMVIYTAASDIPPTPKSPSLSYNDSQQSKPAPGVHLPTNDPKYYEIHQRWTEKQSMGSAWASHNAVKRAESRQMGGAARGLGTGPPASAGHSGRPFFPWPSAKRSEEVLSLLQSDRVKNWTTSKPYDPANPRTIRRHDYPDPAVQAAADTVENVAAQLKGKPFPATEPPAYITDPARVKEWYEGYNREQERKQALQAQSANPASASSADYAAMVEYYSKLGYTIPQPPTAQAQAPYDPYAAYYNQQAQAAQVPAAQQQAGGDANAQLQALMATLAGTGAQNAQQPYTALAAPAPSQPDPSNDPQVQALLASLGSGVSQGQAQYPGQPAVPVPNPNDPAQQAYLAAFAQWAAGQQATGTPTQQQAVAPPPAGPFPSQQQQPSKSFGNEYKQQWEQPDSRDSGGGRGQGQQNKHHAREAREAKQAREARDSQDPSIPSHLRGINRNLIGTKPCTFWRQNKCAKGDKCTFRHD